MLKWVKEFNHPIMGREQKQRRKNHLNPLKRNKDREQ